MAKFKQAADVQGTAVGDRVVLFHRRTQKSIVLNPTGAALWNALSSPLSAEDMAAHLVASHADLTEARAADDVSRYIAQLSEQELIAVDV
jgi:hypothetical protein